MRFSNHWKIVRAIACVWLLALVATDAATLLVTEYGTGNLNAFSTTNAAPITLPASHTPIGGNGSGADGMAMDDEGRLYINRGDGTIWQRATDGQTFSLFATMPDASSDFYLLDLAANATHLYGARFGHTKIYRTALADGTVTTIAGPAAANRFDGVRIGPDGRIYAVDSQNGNIFAYDLNASAWSTFLTSPLAGDASQLEFGTDGRVFVSRTISGQARIYSYTLNTPGNYASGLNAASQTLIGSYGSSGAATGIRIGPDNRLYANAFNAGEIWRSNIGITSMEPTAFITGLSEPGSIFFPDAAAPPPSRTTYHVAPTGSDSAGDGSAGAPWQTIARAARAATQPGDLVLVAPGLYPNDTISFTNSGAAAVALTTGVELVPPNRLVFPPGTDLSAIDLASHPSEYYVHIYRSWISNNGAFLVTNVVAGVSPYVDVDIADWRAETGQAGNPAYLSAAVTRPIVFRNSSTNRTSERVIIEAPAAYTTWYIGRYLDAYDALPTDFIHLDGFDLTGMQGGGIHLQGSSFNVLRDLRIYEGGAPGILMAGHTNNPARYNMILDCRIWNTPAEGIYLGAGGNPPDRNHLHYTHVVGCEIFSVGSGASADMENGIDAKEYNTGHTIERNRIHNLRLISSYNGALHLSHHLTDALVYGNRIENITYNSPRPVAAITVETQGARNLHVFNNLLYRTNALADQTYAFHIKGHPTATNVVIAHNTASRMHRALYLEYYDAGAYDIAIANNVFATGDTAANLIYLGGGTERGTVSHNLWTTAPTRWTTEPGRLTGDPLFLDPDAGNLRLSAGSPAIDSADYPVPWLSVDFDGNLRASQPDRGAFEFAPGSGGGNPPSVPVGLRLLGRSANFIHLGWEPSTGGVGGIQYQIQRDGVALGTTSATNHLDESLAADSAYVYRIRAVDDDANASAYGDPLSVRTLRATADHDATQRGTPYDWLRLHFPDQELFFEAIDEEDSDGDGFATWQEYLADTDPNDPSDFFPPVVAHVAEPLITFEINPSSTARLYRLHIATDLIVPDWHTFTNAPGTGNALFFNHVPTNAAIQFFRTSVTAP